MSISMQSWQWQQQGEPEGLRLVSGAMAPPGQGEVIVENHAIALNPVDWKLIAAGHRDWQPGHVPGVDGAGRIIAVGGGVPLEIGTRVAYHQFIGKPGSFATHTRLSADALLRVPDGLTEIVAAALPCPGITAWQALDKVPAKAGRDVLVIGAGGAVAQYLAQLAVSCQYRVWATAAPRHHAHLLNLGVAGVFDYRDGNWRAGLQAAMGGRKLYAAFDTVSGAHAASLAAMLGYGGHLVCIQDRVEQHPLPPFSSAVSLHELALGSIHEYGARADWVEYRTAGETMLQQLAMRTLAAPAIVTQPFAALPENLAALKAGQPGKRIILL
ncbi:MAG TPA: zinc-binding dehydrogenase [Acidocella sp.]|nr:zinc-binding dehydrogenase [Acidocella sp.]